MRGLPLGLYRGNHLLGVAVFSRVSRPRWAAENFAPIRADRARGAAELRHLTVTEAEYAALTRFALAPTNSSGAPLGTGAASWFLSRALAGLEARNRALWAAHTALARGWSISPVQHALLAEAANADEGLGRGYVKACLTHADPWEGHLGRIYQVLQFHYCGRTNHGRWSRERVGQRSGRRLSARTLAKACRAGQPGHAHAALRLAWEGGSVEIRVRCGTGSVLNQDAAWVRAVASDDSSEPEIARAIRAAWCAWKRDHVRGEASVSLHWTSDTGVTHTRFPPKHAYLVGLGAPWYRRQIEIRHRPLTERLLAERARHHRTHADRRRAYYPTGIPVGELRPELRPLACTESPPTSSPPALPSL